MGPFGRRLGAERSTCRFAFASLGPLLGPFLGSPGPSWTPLGQLGSRLLGRSWGLFEGLLGRLG
eukprot:5546139-Pyramimonas_sp.AAC.1